MNDRPFAIDITDRDLAILRGFYECRLMTLGHVAMIYFAGHGEAAKKRVQKLKAAKLLAERQRRRYEASVLHLTSRGYALLSLRGEIRDYPACTLKQFLRRVAVSEQTVRHELEVMDVKAAVWKAVAAASSLRIATFTTWPRMHSFSVRREGRSRVVKPDGVFRWARAEHSSTFFIELDRSTETTERILDRARDYEAYYRDGGFAAASGAAPSDFRQFPFRVLWVCRSLERIRSIAERSQSARSPIGGMMWFTTLSQLRQNALGHIWQTPKDVIAAMPPRSLLDDSVATRPAAA